MTRVLVTGGTGLIGSIVVKRLLRDGEYEVVVAARDEPPAWISREGYELRLGDLQDPGEARKAIEGCTHVLHLAAIVGGIGNWHRLQYTLTENNNALCNSVFRAAVEAEVERFVYASSAMVFERATVFPTPESYLDECPTPLSPYGFQKLTGEVYCRAANAEFGLPYTIVRPFNAYGYEIPGEVGTTHVIPDLANKILSGERPVPVLGSGAQTRSFTHVEDIADGIVTAMAHPAAVNEDFNISADREVTVAELAALIWEACGEDPAELELEHVPSYKDDVQRRWPSVEKARELLGWEAKVTLEEGIERTISFLREQGVADAVREGQAS
jgi:nucleoside-diphosphate-sugar epimerase